MGLGIPWHCTQLRERVDLEEEEVGKKKRSASLPVCLQGPRMQLLADARRRARLAFPPYFEASFRFRRGGKPSRLANN